MTDLTKWRLYVNEGRQVWKYLPNPTSVQSVVERYLLGLDVSEEIPDVPRGKNAKEALYNAINMYQKIQCPEDGHWANDYGGPMFLLPGLVIAAYMTGHEFSNEHKIEMIRYFKTLQHKDGGWGHHIEAESTMFGTALTYVTARILGEDKDSDWMQVARNWIHKNGTALGIPSWGKFWLAALNVYGWEGLNALTPELWMLPYWMPIHPGKFWCHCRIVYLPMSYVFGVRMSAPLTPFIESLRQELYNVPYDKIDWPSQKWNCCPIDMYTPPTLFLKTVFGALNLYEKVYNSWFRQKAIDEIADNIRVEDDSTHFIDIGPVNKAINMLTVFHYYGADSDRIKQHHDRIYDYLWLAKDGMKMQGYSGSQLWDTAFAIQAILESGMTDEFKDVLMNGHRYLDVSQVRENIPNGERYYRHISKGAWPFSSRDHGWPISDCTAEGLKAALSLKELPFISPLSDDRYFDAVNVILSLQNTDGGWATYENKRGGNWFEWFNPSEVFFDIMVDYSYVECSSACVQALLKFRKHYPNHRAEEIKESIANGVKFIKGIQRSDGSWIGSWGVCFSYAIWFGVDGLVSAGEPLSSPVIKNACKYLVDKQRADGSWGEDFQSCVQRKWVENEKGTTVNTAWAVLALIKGNWDRSAIEKGIKYLMEKQTNNGDWEQESISGVFNANCAISYSGYKNIFPIWALGRYLHMDDKQY